MVTIVFHLSHENLTVGSSLLSALVSSPYILLHFLSATEGPTFAIRY